MPGRKFRSIWFFFLCPCVNGNNWFSYITLGNTYCQSSRRLYVSETSLPYGVVVYINLFIACFVQASDDRLLKMRIDHHNQQLLRLINRLFPIIGTSLASSFSGLAAVSFIYCEGEMHDLLWPPPYLCSQKWWILSTEIEFSKNLYVYVLKAPCHN